MAPLAPEVHNRGNQLAHAVADAHLEIALISEWHKGSVVRIPAEAVVLAVKPAPLILSYVAIVDEAHHLALACHLASDELTIELRL